MTINENRESDKLTVILEGRLDTTTAPELEKYFGEKLEGVNQLTLDMEKLEYISSAGLRVLLAVHKKMSKLGGLTLINVGSGVMEIFEITGFSDILNIE